MEAHDGKCTAGRRYHAPGHAAPWTLRCHKEREGGGFSCYDAWQQAISTLSLGPGGWIQRADFVLLGVMTVGVAVVWRRILAGGVCATWYPVMRGIEGFSLVMIGFFSTDPAFGYPPGSAP
jgi:hypothetical protein